MKNNYSEIVSLLEKYFDLLYKGDVNLIQEVFSKDAHVYSLLDDQVVAINMDLFRKRISERPSPESQNEKRMDTINFIDLSDSKTGLAKINCNLNP